MEALSDLLVAAIPTYVILAFVKLIFAFPADIARAVFNNFVAPKKRHQSWIRKISKSKWKGAWIGPSMKKYTNEAQLVKRVQEADVIIFKVHGGGFRVGNCTMFMDVFVKWIEILKMNHDKNALILSVDYSLSPESCYPTPVLECVAAYEYLIHTLKVPAWKIVFSGDSAGGALCYETLIRVYAPTMIECIEAPRTNFQVPLPAGLFLVSPILTTNTANWSWKECQDDIITPKLVSCVLKEYLNLPDQNPSDLHILRFAHIRQGFERFMPKNLMVYYGDREVMRTGIVEMTDAIKKNSSLNIVVRKEDLYHDWYFLRQLVKQNRILNDADDEFTSFVVRSVSEAQTRNADKCCTEN